MTPTIRWSWGESSTTIVVPVILDAVPALVARAVKESGYFTSRWIEPRAALLVSPFDLRALSAELQLEFAALDEETTSVEVTWRPRWAQLFSWGRGRSDLLRLTRLLLD